MTLGGGWDWRFPGCMCEGMLGGMCAGVVCEDITDNRNRIDVQTTSKVIRVYIYNLNTWVNV